jgi:hypothetical protein
MKKNHRAFRGIGRDVPGLNRKFSFRKQPNRLVWEMWEFGHDGLLKFWSPEQLPGFNKNIPGRGPRWVQRSIVKMSQFIAVESTTDVDKDELNQQHPQDPFDKRAYFFPSVSLIHKMSGLHEVF